MKTNTLDESIKILKARKDEWAKLSIRRKQEYLRGIIDRQVAVAERQVAAATEAKGIPQKSPLEGEEWAAGPYCAVRYPNLLLKTLDQVVTHGRPMIKNGAIRTRPGGQVVVEVFPSSIADRLLYQGFRGEVWMRKEVTIANLEEHMAGFYRQEDPQGKIVLVLGAGNVASIGFLDILTKLYVEGRVCLFKLNPVNEYLGPFIEEVLADLIRDGFVRVVYGGIDVGDYLCQHSDIDEIHMTGSHLTHDAIVYGAGEEGRKHKQNHQPRLNKRLTSELGNVSPIIVVPGPWSNADLEFQCANIATQMINNCGFNCCAAKVLILPREWPLTVVLMDKLRTILSAAPQRKAYYPGAKERYDKFVAANKTAQPIGTHQPGVLPWTIIGDVDPSDRTNICFTTESFCGIMAQTSLNGVNADEFLHNAIEFCNNTLWGTLNACILIHPKTQRSLGESFENALADLRYGSIGVNHWPVISYVWGQTTWGAFPGHTAEDIQSGIGVVHNAFLFDKPERSIIYGPFRMWPKPAWFVNNRQAHKIFPRLVRMEAQPSVSNILGVMLSAIRG
jgi:acyl-CoA reductase-like NAD-dependent aldehyde dehydrogenase